LRNRTRVELAQLRKRVDAPLIMVTHDQAEAMTLADRMIVLNDKRIQQAGAPMEVYSRPANAFVARFVGSPAMTLAPALMLAGGPFARVRLGDGTEVETRVLRDGLDNDTAVQLGLRPEHVSVVQAGAGDTDAETVLVERLGDRTLVYAQLSDGLEVTAQAEGGSRIRMGDRIGLKIDGGSAHVFGPDGTGRHAEPAA
jgi:multiple sugar transport system ATP-binding protein